MTDTFELFPHQQVMHKGRMLSEIDLKRGNKSLLRLTLIKINPVMAPSNVTDSRKSR